MKWKIFCKTIEILVKWTIYLAAFVIVVVLLVAAIWKAQIALMEVSFDQCSQVCGGIFFVALIAGVIQHAYETAREQVRGK